jgi:serine protease Do
VTIEGINFAIPINNVKNILDDLVESGKVERGWLGVKIGDVTAAAATALDIDPNLKGALVTSVFPGDPADLAGIKARDVITRVGEKTVTSAEDLSLAVGALTVGTTVDVELVRDGQVLVVQATLDKRPSEEDLVDYSGKTSGTASEAAFGITVGPITEVMAHQLGLNSTEGVVIMEIASGSRAERAGLDSGDVILGINRRAIDSVEAWDAAVGSIGENGQVTLTVFRSGRLVFVAL